MKKTNQSITPKVAVSYSPIMGGQSVLSVKESFETLGCDIKDADYFEMMDDIDPDFLASAYESLEGRKKLFAHAKAKAKKILADCDCLAIPGNAAMLDPILFNQTRPNDKAYNFSRAIAEMALVHEAMQRGMPIFGVCGGHQLISVYGGGTVRPLSKEERKMHRNYRYDEVFFDLDSLLNDILMPEGICLVQNEHEPENIEAIELPKPFKRAFLYVKGDPSHLYFVDQVANKLQKIPVSEARVEGFLNKLDTLPQQKRLNREALSTLQSMVDEKIMSGIKAFGAHEQAIGELPADFDTAALGEEKAIPEAMISKNQGVVLTTQFHPEVMWRGLKNSRVFNSGLGDESQQQLGENLFTFLRDSAVTYHKKKQLLAELKKSYDKYGNEGIEVESPIQSKKPTKIKSAASSKFKYTPPKNVKSQFYGYSKGEFYFIVASGVVIPIFGVLPAMFIVYVSKKLRFLSDYVPTLQQPTQVKEKTESPRDILLNTEAAELSQTTGIYVKPMVSKNPMSVDNLLKIFYKSVAWLKRLMYKGDFETLSSTIASKTADVHYKKAVINETHVVDELDDKQKAFKEKRAATMIQQAFRRGKVQKTLTLNPYEAYLSLTSDSEKSKHLSALMFGRHVAELRTDADERVNNPLINTSEYYHRSIELKGNLIQKLMDEFEISEHGKQHFDYVPVSLLENLPIEEILRPYLKTSTALDVLKQEGKNIALVAIPKKLKENADIKMLLSHYGVIASAWEIAESIPNGTYAFELSSYPKLEQQFKKYPNTLEDFVKTKLYAKLIRVSKSYRPTHYLAECTIKMLNDMPKLSPQAFQRVALMIDLANQHFESDYPKYATCLSRIIHEISLELAQQPSAEWLATEHSRFLEEAQSTLSHALNIEPLDTDMTKSFAAPAISGMSAFSIARQLASDMITSSGAPTIHVVKPSYYEIEAIIPNQTDSMDADIFAISAGPIVNPEGLTPGVDINKFVKTHIIDAKREKPTSILVDTTTALYKNLKLDDEVKALVTAGKLSIIVHESHQKFGLLHSDQAQYGRVFGICSTQHYNPSMIDKVIAAGQEDLGTHIDMRVGAFISTRCQETLEEVKAQHFRNGAILRSVLSHTPLISQELVTHDTMQTNTDELYFMNTKSYALEAFSRRHINFRSSFGHYKASVAGVMEQRRFSPDGSDEIDNAIQAAQIYLASGYSRSELLSMIQERAESDEKLKIDEQILLLAMIIEYLTSNEATPISASPQTLKDYAAVSIALKQCVDLSGRQYQKTAAQEGFALQKQLTSQLNLKKYKNGYFFEAVKHAYKHHIELNKTQMNLMAKHASLCKVFTILPQHTIASRLLKEFSGIADFDALAEQIMAVKKEFTALVQLNCMKKHPLPLENMVEIAEDGELLTLLQDADQKGFDITPAEINLLAQKGAFYESIHDDIAHIDAATFKVMSQQAIQQQSMLPQLMHK